MVVEAIAIGSESNVADSDRLVISSDRVKAAAYLDMRLLLKSTVMDEKEWKHSKALLQNYYVEFFVCCKAYERKEIEAKKNAIIVSIDTAESDDGDGSSADDDDDAM